MTQYMLTVQGTAEDPEPDMEAMQPVFAAVEAFNDEVRAAGALIFAGGLQPIEASTTVDNTGAELVVTDGPFAETKEWVGGFWLIEAPDLDVALEWAARGSKACASKIEVRAFQAE